MNPRALIAEDEPVLAAVLAKTLQGLWPELEIAAIAPNGTAAVEQALALRPDMLFLDIRMPGQTGLEAAEELLERWEGPAPFPQIVFVTAYDDYAVQAFDSAALDYVLKPVSEARLARTVERLRTRLASVAADASGARAASGANGVNGGDSGDGSNGGNGNNSGNDSSGAHGGKDGKDGKNGNADYAGDGALARLAEQMRALLLPAPSPAPAGHLSVIRAAVGNTVRMIQVEDVVFFQALDKYVNVATIEGDALIRLPLRELLPQLDGARFCQVSRGSIVNLRHVASATRDDAGKLTLALRGRGERLRVSPLFAHLFRQM